MQKVHISLITGMYVCATLAAQPRSSEKSLWSAFLTLREFIYNDQPGHVFLQHNHSLLYI